MDHKLQADLLLQHYSKRAIIDLVKQGKSDTLVLTSALEFKLVGYPDRHRLELQVYEFGRLIEKRDINLLTELLITHDWRRS